MNPAQDNYSNLIGLWKLYGTKELLPNHPSLFHNTGWPYRCWMENPEVLKDTTCVKRELENLRLISPNTTVSLFQNNQVSRNANNTGLQSTLNASGFQHAFNQVAMDLQLNNWQPSKACIDLDTVEVKSKSHIDEWGSIGSNAFGYEIDPSIISNIKDYEGITCLLFELHGTAVATALLYQTGSIMGVHQVAVSPEFQGKGIARGLMTKLINQCKKQQLEAISLQASEAGKHLYDSLGFQPLFDIHNYQAKHFQ